MILIKNRHYCLNTKYVLLLIGKYDTYKGWLDSGLKLLKKSVYLSRLFNFCYTFIGLLLDLLGMAINYGAINLDGVR